MPGNRNLRRELLMAATLPLAHASSSWGWLSKKDRRALLWGPEPLRSALEDANNNQPFCMPVGFPALPGYPREEALFNDWLNGKLDGEVFIAVNVPPTVKVDAQRIIDVADLTCGVSGLRRDPNASPSRRLSDLLRGYVLSGDEPLDCRGFSDLRSLGIVAYATAMAYAAMSVCAGGLVAMVRVTPKTWPDDGAVEVRFDVLRSRNGSYNLSYNEWHSQTQHDVGAWLRVTGKQRVWQDEPVFALEPAGWDRFHLDIAGEVEALGAHLPFADTIWEGAEQDVDSV